MIRIARIWLYITLSLAALIGLSAAVLAESPTVNLPPSLRQSNWTSSRGDGSCFHAAVVSLLRWQGRYHTAEQWKRSYSGGAKLVDITAAMDRLDIRYAATHGKFDVAFLEHAIATRRGACVGFWAGRDAKGNDLYHAVALVDITPTQVALLDNNDVSRIYWVPRNKFLYLWAMEGCDALVPIYTPAPPLP